MRKLLLAVLVATSAPSWAAPAPPSVEGPDIPAVTSPIAVATPFIDERFSCTDEVRTKSIEVPADYDRVILEFTSRPDGDPWDRLFGVSIGGAEVLRGTTPRTTFTIRRDVTEYASLMPRGGSADVGLRVGSYVGALRASVTLSFFASEPTAALVRSADVVVPVARWAGLTGGARTSAAVSFPAARPSSATVELVTTGHGNGEFWYLHTLTPPRFRVLADGAEVMTVDALPYVYALLGFGNANANTPCVGPGTSSTGDRLHPLMWWTAQQAMDVAGVHTGTGEIPAYRIDVPDEQLDLLAGARTVEIVQESGPGYWPTSAAVLLRYAG